ncbi:MAG: succinylglutamate desuccinylase/aspartoacylase family protein [Candidatus Baltobacteraceae bacterium]
MQETKGYNELERSWKALRQRGDVAVREVACHGAPRTLLCAEMGEQTLPAVTISAAVHGDEPASAWALLELAQNGELDAAYAYRLWPCTNPTGFDAGLRENTGGLDVNRTFAGAGSSPEARAILTANRNRRFVLALDLHEDDTMAGFYCYEYGSGASGKAAAAAVRAAGFPVEQQAVLRPDPALERQTLGGMSYTLRLLKGAVPHAVTLETPSRLPLEERIAIHRIAVKAALGAPSKQLRHG